MLSPCSAFIGHSFTSCTRRICNRDYFVKEALAKFVWAVAVAVAIFARLLKRWTDEKAAADKGRQKKGVLMLSVIAFLAPIPLFRSVTSYFILLLPSIFACLSVGGVLG